MADIFPLLRQRKISPIDDPYGMPRFDDSDALSDVFGLAQEAKNQDMRRRREMMQFQQDLQMKANAPAIMRQKIEDARKLNPANKKVGAVHYGGPVKMAPSTVEADNAARDAKAADINAEFAKVNEARNERAAQRSSTEKIARDKLDAATLENQTERDFKSKEAAVARKDKGWQVFNTQDPNDPTKVIPKRLNLATGEVSDVDSGTLQKPGSKFPGGDGKDPKLQNIRDMTQSALDEIDQLSEIGDDGKLKLKSHARDATGMSRLPGALLDKVGLGSLTPSTTKGRTGIQTLKSKLVVDLIGHLKAQSRTGATGFGNMSNKDLAVLERAANKLNEDMSDDDFAEELARVKEKLKMIMEDKKEEPTGPPKPGTPESARDKMRKYGYGG